MRYFANFVLATVIMQMAWGPSIYAAKDVYDVHKYYEEEYEEAYQANNGYPSDAKTKRQFHHFFNARLLPPKERQISVFGNFRVGLTNHWEVGVQIPAVVVGALNASVKHEMFSIGRHQTTFTSHSFYLRPQSDGTTEEEETVTASSFFSVFGVVTTTKLQDGHFLNWGLLDFYLRHTRSEGSVKLNAHMLTPMIGYDFEVQPSLVLSGVLTYPALLLGRLESDFADAEIMAFLTNIPSNVNPWAMFLTATFTSGNFNIEGGVLAISGIPLPYLNLFWRFS